MKLISGSLLILICGCSCYQYDGKGIKKIDYAANITTIYHDDGSTTVTMISNNVLNIYEIPKTKGFTISYDKDGKNMTISTYNKKE